MIKYVLKYTGPMASVYYLDYPYTFPKDEWVPVDKKTYHELKKKPNMDQDTRRPRKKK